MKILAATDIHADTLLTKKLAETAKKENVDLVVLAGDLTFYGKGLERLLYPFKEKGVKVALIPGNHDPPELIDFISNKYKFYNLHNYPLVLGDTAFIGAGFADIGPYYISDEDLYNKIIEQMKIAKKKNAKKIVIVSHSPPNNTKLDDIGMHVGSESLRKLIEKYQPDLCICGHIHEAFGLEDKIGKSKVINPGQEGKIINI